MELVGTAEVAKRWGGRESRTVESDKACRIARSGGAFKFPKTEPHARPEPRLRSIRGGGGCGGPTGTLHIGAWFARVSGHLARRRSRRLCGRRIGSAWNWKVGAAGPGTPVAEHRGWRGRLRPALRGGLRRRQPALVARLSEREAGAAAVARGPWDCAGAVSIAHDVGLQEERPGFRYFSDRPRR